VAKLLQFCGCDMEEILKQFFYNLNAERNKERGQ